MKNKHCRSNMQLNLQTHRVNGLLRIVLLGVLSVAFTSAQAGRVGSCINQYNTADIHPPAVAPYYADINCTANESAISSIELSQPNPGCFFIGQTPVGDYNIKVGLTGANTSRYDLGLFLNILGTDPFTETSAVGCYQEYLEPNPVSDPGGTEDLLTGYGRFEEYDNSPADTCGDIEVNEVFRVLEPEDQSNMPAPIPVVCADNVDSNADANPNGLLDMGGCTSYANNDVQDICVDMDGPLGALVPGTKSKCNCTTRDTIPPTPIADLSFQCSCYWNPSTEQVDCNLQVANALPSGFEGVVAANTNDEQAGTARFFRLLFNDVDPGDPNIDAGGEFSNFVANAFVESSGLTSPSNDFIMVPQGGLCDPTVPTNCSDGMGGILDNGVNALDPQDYVLGAGQTASLDFSYVGDPDFVGAGGNDIVALQVTTQFDTFDVTAPSPEISSTTIVNCPSVFATYAGVRDVWAGNSAGNVQVHWETTVELGTQGFDLLRLDTATGEYVQVNSELLPAAGEIYGGFYAVPDPGANPGEALTYQIRETEIGGHQNTYGPFEVRVGARGNGKKSGADGGVTAKGPNPQALARFEKGKKDKQQATSANGANSPSTAPGGGNVAIAGAKLITNEAGVHQVSAQALAGPLGLTVKQVQQRIGGGKLALSNKGRAVAWEAGANGDSLRFYATAHRTMFSHENVYRVALGAGPTISSVAGTAPAPVSGATFSEQWHSEEDVFPQPYAPGVTIDDLWFWQVLSPGGTNTFAVATPGVDSGAAGDATLTVRVATGFGFTASSNVTVNGTSVGAIQWDGNQPASITVPHSVLQADNTVAFENIGFSTVILGNSISVDYQRGYVADAGALIAKPGADTAVSVTGFASGNIAVYDVTDANAPLRLQGIAIDQTGSGQRASFSTGGPDRTFVAVSDAGVLQVARIDTDYASNLNDTNHTANYLVIGPAYMQAGVQSLLDRRATQTVNGVGVEPKFVDIVDVMDDFNDGIMDPNALAQFVAHADNNWQQPLLGVLIAGNGHFDYRDVWQNGGNLVPPVLAKTLEGFVAADLMMGDTDGNGTPNVPVGRVPAVSVAEMQGYSDKLVAYETSGGGAWTNDVLMIADNPDFGGNFPVDSDALINTLPGGYDIERVYLGQTHATPGAAKSAIINSLNQGAILSNFTGHGDPIEFTAEGILTYLDAEALTNVPRSPVVTALTCLINFHVVPGIPVLGQSLLLNPDGGAIAVWGPVSYSINQTAVTFGKQLLPELLSGTSESIGGRAVSAMVNYADANGNKQLFFNYSLFGDPLARLQ